MKYPFLTRKDVLKNILENYDNEGNADSTGYKRLDEAMGGGLYPSKLYIFCARKKVGKTMLLGGISHHLNINKIPHLWLALEMNGMELEQRQLSRELGINAIAFLKHKDGKLKNKLTHIAGNGMADNMLYCEASGIREEQLAEVITDAVENHDIRGVFIDFLQLIGGGSPDQMAVHHDKVAYTCANLCKTLGIWIAAAAQLNQDNNFRGGEGALMAADQVYHLNRTEDHEGLWMTLRESRYTPYMDIGNPGEAGYLVNERQGPYLIETQNIEDIGDDKQSEI